MLKSVHVIGVSLYLCTLSKLHFIACTLKFLCVCVCGCAHVCEHEFGRQEYTTHSQDLHILQPSYRVASFPGLHTQLLSQAVRKVGGRTGGIYHVMRAAADVT